MLAGRQGYGYFMKFGGENRRNIVGDKKTAQSSRVGLIANPCPPAGAAQNLILTSRQDYLFWRQIPSQLRVATNLRSAPAVFPADFPASEFSANRTRSPKMSLYIEAASILNETSGSLRSRIYHRPASSPQLKSPPARLYALIIETLKHQEILNEVIAKSELLKLERKVFQLLLLTTICPTSNSKLTILLHLFSPPRCSQ